jgi:hypothetical protein
MIVIPGIYLGLGSPKPAWHNRFHRLKAKVRTATLLNLLGIKLG